MQSTGPRLARRALRLRGRRRRSALRQRLGNGAHAAIPTNRARCGHQSSSRRGMRAATAWSWVMTTMVVPSARLSSSSRSRMRLPLALSRLPVGSSASTTLGRPTMARAMATRCRWPPGELARAGARRDARDHALESLAGEAAALVRADPAIQEAVGHVVESGHPLARRKNCWKTKPTCSLRRPESSLIAQLAHVVAGHRDASPAVRCPTCPARAAGWTCPSRTDRPVRHQLAGTNTQVDVAQRLHRRWTPGCRYAPRTAGPARSAPAGGAGAAARA